MKAALLQLTSSDDPNENARMVAARAAQAADHGARFVLTPEVTNCVSLSRTHQQDVLRHEGDDQTLAALRAVAAEYAIWISIGSLAVKTDEDRFANRSFVIDPKGRIAARYDKIHMFDVELSAHESYRESAGYRPGGKAVLCSTDFGVLGLSICYDLRFPALYRTLAQAGAQIILIPAAFAVATGKAHWEPLLRARAIECGAYVLAAAQTGRHPATDGTSRDTYGHSMAISPWGEILTKGTGAPETLFVDLDLAQVETARTRIPSLRHDRVFGAPI